MTWIDANGYLSFILNVVGNLLPRLEVAQRLDRPYRRYHLLGHLRGPAREPPHHPERGHVLLHQLLRVPEVAQGSKTGRVVREATEECMRHEISVDELLAIVFGAHEATVQAKHWDTLAKKSSVSGYEFALASRECQKVANTLECLAKRIEEERSSSSWWARLW